MNTIYYHLYVEPKTWHKGTHLQSRNRLIDIENGHMVAKEEREGNGMDRDLGVNRCKLFHLDWISNEVLMSNFL